VSTSRRKWLAVAAWVLVIETLTSWPSPPSFGAPHGSDKVVHFTMYAALGFLALRAAWVGGSSLRWRRLLVVAACVSLWGALDEWHQQFIPSRSMELGDWIADSIGAIAGVTMFTLTAGRAGVSGNRRESET
jgi:VanZ family protein